MSRTFFRARRFPYFPESRIRVFGIRFGPSLCRFGFVRNSGKLPESRTLEQKKAKNPLCFKKNLETKARYSDDDDYYFVAISAVGSHSVALRINFMSN